jgi:hypothetical protein
MKMTSSSWLDMLTSGHRISPPLKQTCYCVSKSLIRLHIHFNLTRCESIIPMVVYSL